MITFSSLLPDVGTRLSTLAIELPRSITPAVAGLTVGLFVGVVGVIAVLVFVGRGQRRSVRRARLGADEVVFIPPYGTMRRDTPLPPRAFARDAAVHAPVPGYGFRPSSALSARAFAKMGYSDEDADYVGAGVVERATEIGDSPSADPMVTIDVDFADDSEVFEAAPQPVSVAPVVLISAEKSAEKSAPHPLGIIKSTSEAMRPASASSSDSSSPMRPAAASIAELSFDDSPTEIGETYFDEPPQPRRRTDPPRIRPITPAGPRFPDPRVPEKTPRMPQVAAAKNDRQHP